MKWKNIGKRDDFPISPPDWYWEKRDYDKVIWFYTRGLGDNLLSIAHMAKYADKHNLPFYIYPYFCTFYSHFYMYENIRLYNLFFNYFKPKYKYEVLHPNFKFTKDFMYTAKHNLFEVALDSLGIDNIPIINKYVSKQNFEQFDKEYDILNSRFNIKNLQGGHLRLVYGNVPRVDMLILYIQSLKKKPSFLAMDSTSYLSEYKNILPEKIFVLSDIYRVDKNTDIEYDFKLDDMKSGEEMLIDNASTFLTHRTQALKEAYFISKCDTFIPSKSSFSTLISFLRE